MARGSNKKRAARPKTTGAPPPAKDAPSQTPEKRGIIQKALDGIEKVGNKVPHPVLMFLYLIAFIIVLSHVLYLVGVSVTTEVIEPAPVTAQPYYYEDTTYPPLAYDSVVGDADRFEVREETIPIRSLLTIEGIRFIFTSFLPNFAGFTVVATIFVAMIGVGVAEEAGMMAALIRKLVKVAPARLITFIIVLLGGISSVATDAGYLILIPLGAAAFLSLKRHPVAGLVAAFAGVSVAFAVNILIAPLDAMLTEMTNEAYQLVNPNGSISIVANLYFNIFFTIFVAIIVTLITERMIEPRLGKFVPDPLDGAATTPDDGKVDIAAEERGLRQALFWFLGALVIILVLTLPPGAPLRRPTGELNVSSPLLDSLIFIITLLFLFAGIGYGRGAGTIKSSNDVIAGVTKTFAGLASLIFLLLIISQFIGLFNYSNMPQVLGVALARILEQANIGAVPLLVGMILVIFLLDFIIPGSMPKWAIFAPVFVPLFVNLGVTPQTVLAAYRIGDSPANIITPLMVYFPFIVMVAQRYDKKIGIGSVISLMLPYTLIVLVVWIILFVLWFVLGIPLGPGHPVSM